MRQVTERDYAPGKTPRDYQLTAINRTVEAIARGQNRVLLVMATGTGKTYTAFQIIWPLWKSSAKKPILHLADRNILIDQTMVNDFRPFKGAVAKQGMKQEILTLVDRSTHGICKLESPKIFGLPIPVPPLEEQSRIVVRVTELRCLRADLRQRLTAQQTVQSHLADTLVEQALA